VTFRVVWANVPAGTRVELRDATVAAFGAVLAAIAVRHTFVENPVVYTILITEDSWAEFGTAAAFVMAALLLVPPLARADNRRQRALLAVYVLGCLVIAGEEISWGQRLLDLSTPEGYAAMNLQGEINLHNLAAARFLTDGLHARLGYAVAIWCLGSMLLRTVRPGRFHALRAGGAPVIPMALLPVFLLPSYFLVTYPVAKSDEIGELLGSVAVMLWTLDLALAQGPPAVRRGTVRLGLTVASLVLMASAAGVLSLSREPRLLTYRLNLMASRDYPDRGMYDQSLALYEHIYRNPQHTTPDTRIEHARLLAQLGDAEAARQMALQAIDDLERRPANPLNQDRLAAAREILGLTS